MLRQLERFDDPEFQFDEPTHTYHYKGTILQSVSTFVSSFKEKFDADKWAPKKARERGISVDDILAEWDAKNKRACDLGHEVHLYAEKLLMGEAPSVDEIADPEVRYRCVNFKELYNGRLRTLDFIAAEVRMFDEGMGLAGTFDSLALHGDKVWLLDHKTNGKMTTDDDKHYRMLKAPFDFLKENSLNSYSIQQSCYALMLERIGMEVEGMVLSYIPPDGPAKLLRCKDLRPILKEMLKHGPLA